MHWLLLFRHIELSGGLIRLVFTMTALTQAFSAIDITEGEYLKRLFDIERRLPALLEKNENWQSLDVDYHPPKVERLWLQLDDLRVYLHRIYPAKIEDVLFHPHPWPSAMRILKGAYQMGIGYGDREKAPPIIASTFVLPENACYEMVNINGWHYVCPVNEVAYSLMIAGRPWQGYECKSDLALQGLTDSKREEILNFFRKKFSHN